MRAASGSLAFESGSCCWCCPGVPIPAIWLISGTAGAAPPIKACRNTFCCSSDQTVGSGGGAPLLSSPKLSKGVWERELDDEEGRGGDKESSMRMFGTGGSVSYGLTLYNYFGLTLSWHTIVGVDRMVLASG